MKMMLIAMVLMMFLGVHITPAASPDSQPATQAAPATTATAPSTQPRSLDTVENGKSKVKFTFWQEDKPCLPNKDGVVHLKPQAFEIRFTGSVNDVLLLASTQSKTADAMDKAKGPVITLDGMSAAYDDGMLLIEDKANVQPWEKFAKVFSNEEAAKFTQTLRDKLHVLPTVLEAGWQLLRAEDNATSCTFKVKMPLDADLKATKELWLLVMLKQPVDKEDFFSLKWRRIKLAFD